MTINLRMPDITELKPKITVFGVGGAGGNAVNNMIRSGLMGCEFVVANTDSQALSSSQAERMIQMGVRLWSDWGLWGVLLRGGSFWLRCLRRCGGFRCWESRCRRKV